MKQYFLIFIPATFIYKTLSNAQLCSKYCIFNVNSFIFQLIGEASYGWKSCKYHVNGKKNSLTISLQKINEIAFMSSRILAENSTLFLQQ